MKVQTVFTEFWPGYYLFFELEDGSNMFLTFNGLHGVISREK
jgi:hypothetical protein